MLGGIVVGASAAGIALAAARVSVVFQTAQGDYTYFGATHAVLGGGLHDSLAVPLVGVLGGLLGGSFSR